MHFMGMFKQWSRCHICLDLYYQMNGGGEEGQKILKIYKQGGSNYFQEGLNLPENLRFLEFESKN